MKVAIMQPTYLPWLGYFDLMAQVDAFVFLDNVQLAKRSWQQRNQIRTRRGLEWITVPILVSGRYHQIIADVVFNSSDFVDEHLRLLIENYRDAPFFGDLFDPFARELHRRAATGKLVELNCGMIAFLCEQLGNIIPVHRASNLMAEGNRSALLAGLCQSIGADTYVSALGSAKYLIEEIDKFDERKVKVEFQNYVHPQYQQCYQPFVPQASIIDLLFNEGPNAGNIVRSGRATNFSVDEMKQRLALVANE